MRNCVKILHNYASVQYCSAIVSPCSFNVFNRVSHGLQSRINGGSLTKMSEYYNLENFNRVQWSQGIPSMLRQQLSHLLLVGCAYVTHLTFSCKVVVQNQVGWIQYLQTKIQNIHVLSVRAIQLYFAVFIAFDSLLQKQKFRQETPKYTMVINYKKTAN